MPLYTQLKAYRSRLGVNQQELGRRAGVSRQTINDIEKGLKNPTIKLSLAICLALDKTQVEQNWEEAPQ